MLYVDLNVFTQFGRGIREAFNMGWENLEILDFAGAHYQSGLQLEDFFDHLDNTEEFWLRLHPQPYNEALIGILDDAATQWRIVTSGTSKARSWGGKAEWVRRHLGVCGMKQLQVLGHGIAGVGGSHDRIIGEARKEFPLWGERRFQWVPYRDPALHELQMAELRKWLDRTAGMELH